MTYSFQTTALYFQDPTKRDVIGAISVNTVDGNIFESVPYTTSGCYLLNVVCCGTSTGQYAYAQVFFTIIFIGGNNGTGYSIHVTSSNNQSVTVNILLSDDQSNWFVTIQPTNFTASYKCRANLIELLNNDFNVAQDYFLENFSLGQM